MLDSRTMMLLGKAMIIGVGPLCLLASLLIITRSGNTISTATTIWSYLMFMVALGAFAGGAYLWYKARRS